MLVFFLLHQDNFVVSTDHLDQLICAVKTENNRQYHFPLCPEVRSQEKHKMSKELLAIHYKNILIPTQLTTSWTKKKHKRDNKTLQQSQRMFIQVESCICSQANFRRLWSGWGRIPDHRANRKEAAIKTL